jgi:glycosyltransferase involved in cell wall biosynthesis
VTRSILHFAQDSDTSGFFPQLARLHDRTSYRMFFGTLNPMAPWLREYMESQGVECFDARARERKEYPLALGRLVRCLRRGPVDILHTHLFEPSVIGLVGGAIARTPLRIVTRHYSDYHTRIHKRWHVHLDQMCTRLSHAVIAVSRHTGEHMIQAEGASPEKVEVVPNGIDFERVKPSSVDARKRVREELGIGNGHLVLIVARLHPEKGYEYLFEALPDLKKRVTRPFLVAVAGTGALEGAFRERVRSLGCDQVVRFLGFRRDVPDLMVASDLVVLPSLAEAFGLAVAEALYLGVPVVATRTGGLPEIVTDGVDGLLVPPADSVALAAAIADLLNDPHRRAALAGRGRERIHREFSFERMLRAYERIYDRLWKRRTS